MTRDALADLYRAYLDCLNRQDWAALGDFVHENARHNGIRFGLRGYREMLIDDFRRIPDLHFSIGLLACEPPVVAARLLFDCTPVGELFGIAVNGRRVQFSENVFYRFHEGRILEVHSVIDRAAIARQVEE